MQIWILLQNITKQFSIFFRYNKTISCGFCVFCLLFVFQTSDARTWDTDIDIHTYATTVWAPMAYVQSFSVGFLWDVMLWSRVWDAIASRGIWYVFSGLAELASQQATVVINLETSVTTGWNKKNKLRTFRAHPDHLDWFALRKTPIIANIANNHIWDYGPQWVLDTLHHLQQRQIHFFGWGVSKQQAHTPYIFTLNATRIGLIGQTCIQPQNFEATWSWFVATDTNKAWNAQRDTQFMEQNIENLKQQGVDIIIFNGHCGTEYSQKPNLKQISMYEAAIDAWADIVIGHHPHVYQWIQAYKNWYIFYSLGNAIFDIFRNRDTQEWLFVSLEIQNKKIQKINIVPLYTSEFWNTVIAPDNRTRYVLDALQNLSNTYQNISTIASWYINVTY